MTAEVAVLNKHAIALAADSAATVPSTGKIYSANKLLALSKRRPVGTMIYNASEFLGLPWESLIKRFRSDQPKRSHNTMREWVDDFIGYLDGVVHDVPIEVRDRDAIEAYARFLGHAIAKARKALDKPDGAIPSEALFPEVDKAISLLIGQLRDEKRRGAMSPLSVTSESVSALLERHTTDLDEVEKVVFSNHSDPIPNLIDRRHVIMSTLGSFHNHYFHWSGVVIAGFGDQQWFPGIHDLVIGGTIGTKVRRWEKSAAGVDWANQGRVMAFAQDDVVQSFMEGIYPDIRQEMTGAIANSLEQEYPELVMDLLSKGPLANADPTTLAELRAKLEVAGGKITLGLMKRFQSESRNKHANPIMNSIGHLSKDELASLAESLVTTTSLKRRMHADSQENVGGAVDVAVISRTEGFIWIKRKHYFDPLLNPSFTQYQAEW